MSIWNYIKEHPYGVAAGVFGVGLLLIILRNSSGSDPVTGSVYRADSNAAEVSAGTQLQAYALQAQTQQQNTQAEANVASQQVAGQVTIAQLQAQVADNANHITGTVQQNSDTLSAQTAQLIATLQASVQNTSTNATLEATRIAANEYTSINAQNAATSLAIARAPYESADYIAQLSYNLQMAQLPTNAEIANLQHEIDQTNTNLGNLATTQMHQITDLWNNEIALTNNTNAALTNLNNWGLRYWGGAIGGANTTTLQPLPAS